ncbi:RagB/SusD family nutrient uptake outer membrane protein [Hymenobacter metallicola]|uniref:RagB/SusD family nutrient uptake outer membrane protein n=1 Tax=Hymenobacter metallicola TaxID=2563114 RepID=A0A4Z0Q173_9BACT|nr:RagB/SusD family nutrient uptake outer membrane protein [Hymenobacter metallicola]TGE23435.1 RagB/SusD family nutrient uptake outer membrane protein [Hymenobacter metallicola]
MKRIFRPTIAALGIVCLTGVMSCKDFLEIEPNSFDTTEQVFSTVSGATSAVMGAYDPMSGDAGYGNRLSSFFPFDSDEMQSSQGGNDAGTGRRGIARYSSVATNAEVQNPWNTLYQGVERANICIKNIPQMAQFQGGADMAAVKRLYGEALTLRAQYYFELIRNWGDVPAQFEPSVTGQDFNIPRENRYKIYDRLLADLDEAAKVVPWRTAVTADERITKGAVKALRARIALYRAGYSLSQSGVVERAPDYRQFYDTVRVECQELMAQRAQHNLNSSYEETFRSINELRRDANREIIFEVGMGGASAASDSKLGYYNGPRINASPKYGASSGAITALPTYFYAFDSLDVRRDVTLAPYTIESNDAQKATNLLTIYDGKFRRDWRSPLVSGASVQSLGYNWPLIRFADVLLMFAEAQNELAGPTATFKGVSATQALMEVRLRAFRGNATAAGKAPADQATFFTFLQNERFLEFGGEGIRKYDLIRWNLLGPKLDEAKKTLRAWLADKTPASPYANIPLTMYYTVTNGQIKFVRSFYRPAPTTAPAGATAVAWRSAITEARVADIASGYVTTRQLLPIPATSLNTNNRLVQNPGYN